jgi:general secretion pathway protein K
MVIVTLIATLAAGMVWQQWRAVQVEAAERAQVQAQWILNGALDWARLILREDGRSNNNGGTDNLSEPWAVPLSEARLSTFLSADGSASDDGPDAFLSGSIVDAQSRYNLRNLVQPGGKVNPEELKVLQRLCTQVALNPEWAGRIANALAAALQGTTDAGGRSSNTATASDQQLLLPPSERQLSWFGLDPAMLAPLLPYVVLLPAPTPVNLNTAPKEVLAAVIAGIDLGTAERIVQARQRQPLRNADEDVRAIVGSQVTLAADRLNVRTSYFEVTGTLRLDALVVSQRSLVRRDNRDITVLRTERLRDIPTPLQQ